LLAEQVVEVFHGMRVRWLVISLTFALLFLWGAAVVWAMPAQPHRLDPAHLTDLRTPTPVPIEPLLIVGGMPGLGIYPDYCCGEASFQYMFNNAWRGIRHGRLMEVVAGRVKGTDQRNTIVGIQIWEDGSWHHDGYQVWPTPQKVGCVEVVSVVGSLATLQACNPQLPPIQFVFDVDRHVWVGKPPPLYPPSAASAAAGGRLSGQMAYVEDDELWLLDLATNKRVQLTDTREGSMPAVGNGFPQWIADGQHLVNWRTWLHGKDATIDFMKLDLATGWDIQLGDLGTLGLNPYTQRSLQTHYAMPSLDPHPPGFYCPCWEGQNPRL
jgi:hypothetical protein